MAAEVSSNNEIKIRDGVIMHQGCAASIKKNTYDSVTIVNGSQGMKRIDLIVARYQRNQDDGKEFMRFVAIQGTPAESNPAVPSHITGDIQSGDAVADMPMYKIIIDGLNIVEVKKVFSEAPNITELNRKLPFCGRGKGTVTSNEANSLNIPVTFPTAMNNTDYVVCANLVTGSIGAFDKNYDVEVIVTKKSLTGCTLSIMRGTFGFLDYGAVLSVEYIVLPS